VKPLGDRRRSGGEIIFFQLRTTASAGVDSLLRLGGFGHLFQSVKHTGGKSDDLLDASCRDLLALRHLDRAPCAAGVAKNWWQQRLKSARIATKRKFSP